MAITDQFGREYASEADFRPTPIAEHRRLTETVSGRYLGLLTRWHGVGWTHSLSRFGEPALSDLGTALHAFMHRAGITEHVSVGPRNGRALDPTAILADVMRKKGAVERDGAYHKPQNSELPG